MFFQYTLGGNAEVMLSPDDEEAICAAYSPERPVPAACNPEPPHGFAADCGANVVGGCAVATGPHGGPSGPAALVLLLVIVGTSRVRRRVGDELARDAPVLAFGTCPKRARPSR